ncbi:MAG TPA: hypothetical protein VH253_15860 [Phycisphaerae bacterium]|nr:hypothetical protein [Phycisphaerae bacterium]
MMGVFVRELRENLKWAAVIFVVLLAICVHGMRDASAMLLYALAQATTPFLAAIAGLLMGAAQAMFEVRPDNWAFVVHRPVRRGRIFAAKCAAGLGLLYGALGLPCALTAAWAAWPGHVALPFQWRMALPLTADVLSAGCYYFAGMVLLLRRARWHGTRLLPLGLAVFGTVAAYLLIPGFAAAAAVLLAIQAIGATAAWGVFSSNGEMDGPAVTRGALGAMMYPGALALGMFILGLSTSFNVGGHWQYYQVDRDGNIVRVTETIADADRTFAFDDVAGKPLPQYEHVDPNDPAYAGIFVRFNAFLVDPPALPWAARKFESDDYRSPTPGVARLSSVAPPGVRVPFLSLYDVPQRLIELIDPVSHRKLGSVGPAGFSAVGTAPTERFSGTPLNLASLAMGRAIAFPSVVYWIELDQRRVRRVFTAAQDDPVLYAAQLAPPQNPAIVVSTRRRLYALRPTGETLFDVPMSVDPAAYEIAPAILANHHLLLETEPLPTHPELQAALWEYDQDGKLLRETAFPRQPDYRSPKVTETAMFGLIFPLAARPLCPTWVLDRVLDIRTMEFAQVFDAGIAAGAVLAAAVTFWVARRYRMGAGTTSGWIVGNLLLGPAGVVVMLGLYTGRGRERCARCGGTREILPAACGRCGAGWSVEVADGREIFEPADACQGAPAGVEA